MVKTCCKDKIKPDMLIGDILSLDPSKTHELANALMDFGIHCVGCGAAKFESLQEGVLAHGYSEQEFQELLDNLNKIMNKKSEKKSPEGKHFKIKFTEKAVKKLNELIDSQDNKMQILRISVLMGGCSGYTYDMELIKNPIDGDLIFEQDGLNISTDMESMELLNGTEVDYIDTLNEAGFKFNNPNATKSCGCGKSFS